MNVNLPPHMGRIVIIEYAFKLCMGDDLTYNFNMYSCMDISEGALHNVDFLN